MKRLRYAAGAGVAVLGLAGCMGPTSLKPMLDDSEGYSVRYFSLNMLSPAARASLAAPGTEPLGFKRLTAKGEVLVSDTNAPASHRHIVFEHTLINDGNDGMVRAIERRSVDGLPLLIDYWSSYRGVAMLSVQRGLPARNLAAPIMSVRSVSTWKSMANMQEHTTYDYVANYGYGDPLRSSLKLERRCMSGTFHDAGKIAPGLTGQAIDLTCDDINGSGAKSAQSDFVWLRQYGVALVTKLTTLNGITSFKYDSVTAQ